MTMAGKRKTQVPQTSIRGKKLKSHENVSNKITEKSKQNIFLKPSDLDNNNPIIGNDNKILKKNNLKREITKDKSTDKMNIMKLKLLILIKRKQTNPTLCLSLKSSTSKLWRK